MIQKIVGGNMRSPEESMRHSEHQPINEKEATIQRWVSEGKSLPEAEQLYDSLNNPYLQNAYVAPANHPAAVRERTRHQTTNNSPQS